MSDYDAGYDAGTKDVAAVLADNAEQRLRDVTSGEPCPCGDWHTRLPCCGVPDTDCERANGDFSDYLGHVDHCIRGRRG